MKRIAIFAYGIVSYLVFFGTFLYAVGFIGGFAVPTQLDGIPKVSTATAVLMNLALLALFAVQHSVMARPWFKKAWTRIVPEAAERSTYVLFSSLALIAMFIFWQPVGGVIWQVQNPVVQNLVWSLFALGWGVVFFSTLLINHFDLFGLRQVWFYLRGKQYEHPKFATPLLYRYVRHPLYVGWLMCFWFTNTMTAAHLLFSLMTTTYILMAIRWEEKDLADVHGEAYRKYRESVPMLVPSVAPYRQNEKPAGRRAIA